MPKSYVLALAMVAALIAAPAYASDNASNRKVIFEAAVKIASDAAYMEILRQAWSKGWRFTPEQIEHGSKRHLDELKLQLIDQGYTILPGEAGA